MKTSIAIPVCNGEALLRRKFGVDAFAYFPPVGGKIRFMHGIFFGRCCNAANSVCIVPNEHLVEGLSTHQLTCRDVGVDGAVGKHARLSGRLDLISNRSVRTGEFDLKPYGKTTLFILRFLLVRGIPMLETVPLISVIVPIYNGEKHLAETLSSLQWWDFNIADFGLLDWSDVHRCTEKIKAAIASGAKPYASRRATSRDLRPYSTGCGFLFEWSRRRIRIKLFWIWVVHVVLPEGGRNGRQE